MALSPHRSRAGTLLIKGTRFVQLPPTSKDFLSQKKGREGGRVPRPPRLGQQHHLLHLKPSVKRLSPPSLQMGARGRPGGRLAVSPRDQGGSASPQGPMPRAPGQRCQGSHLCTSVYLGRGGQGGRVGRGRKERKEAEGGRGDSSRPSLEPPPRAGSLQPSPAPATQTLLSLGSRVSPLACCRGRNLPDTSFPLCVCLLQALPCLATLRVGIATTR